MRDEERNRLKKVHSIGPKMISYFEAIGLGRIEDFAGRNAGDIAMMIDVHLGAKRMNRLGIAAIQNVIDAANQLERRDDQK